MKSRSYVLPALLLAVAFSAIVIVYVATYPEPAVGAALPQSPAVFETSLQSPITSSATTMTLTANSVRGGGALVGYNCFTIDEGSAQAEYVCGTVSGTTVSSLTRAISPTTGTTTVSALQFAHRRGANVKITDFPVLQILKAQANGQDTYPNILQYTSTVCSGSSPNAAICDKAYIDGVAVAGASNANETTKGIVELSTTAEAAAGTSAGATGARLAIPASMCSASFSAATLCVITSAAGKIAQGFLDLTADFSFGGKFNLAATTTIAASSTQGNPLKLNNVAYKFPGANGASSTVLSSDGAGALSWMPTTRALTVASPNASTATNASTTLATVLIPANTITTTSQLQITSLWAGVHAAGRCYYDISFGNGVAGTSTIAFATADSGNIASITGSIAATSTTNGFAATFGQYNNVGITVLEGSAGAPAYGYGAYLPYNFAATTYIAFRALNPSATNCALSSYSVQLIQ